MELKKSPQEIEVIKAIFTPGSRIVVDSVRKGNNPPDASCGMAGIVKYVNEKGSVYCKMDNGKEVALLLNADNFHLENKSTQQEMLLEQHAAAILVTYNKEEPVIIMTRDKEEAIRYIKERMLNEYIGAKANGYKASYLEVIDGNEFGLRLITQHNGMGIDDDVLEMKLCTWFWKT